MPRAEALHSWHETCLAFFVTNKDFDERLIVTYSIKYRNYLRKIREKQVIRAQKTLHNGKVHAKKVLLKLTRALDLDFLAQGQPYKDLKPSYVIFICTFDRFKMDEPVYFFRSWDVEKGLPLDDFSYKIVLNAACSPDKVPEKLKPLYAYLNDPRQSQVSPLTRMIDARVKKFNTDEWRRKYMTFEYMLKERERIGIEQGRAEGHAAGLSEGHAAGLSEGRSEGEAIGLKKGAAQEKRAIAKNFKHAGIPVDVIAENTGLTAEEIENL